MQKVRGTIQFLEFRWKHQREGEGWNEWTRRGRGLGVFQNSLSLYNTLQGLESSSVAGSMNSAVMRQWVQTYIPPTLTEMILTSPLFGTLGRRIIIKIVLFVFKQFTSEAVGRGGKKKVGLVLESIWCCLGSILTYSLPPLCTMQSPWEYWRYLGTYQGMAIEGGSL